MSDVQLFHCPNCGAPLDLPERKASVRCPYCDSSIIVPDAVREGYTDFSWSSSEEVIALGDIHLLVANGKRAEAIELVASQTGFTPQASEAIVDAIERGDPQEIAGAIAGAMDTQWDKGHAGHTVVSTNIQFGDEAAETVTRAVGIAGGLTGCWLAVIIFVIVVVSVVPIFFALTTTGGPLAAVWSQINPAGIAKVDLRLSGEGIGPGQFDDPRAVAADQEGNLYVADYSTGRIQSFDSEGGFRWLLNLGEDTIIESMDIGSGDILYVVAQGDLRRFESESGSELRPYSDPSGFYYFDDVAVALDGRVALIYGGENLLVLNNELQPLMQVPEAVSSVTNDSELDSDVDMDALGNLFILGSFNNLVLKYSPEGRYINQFGGESDDRVNGTFQAVGDLAVDRDGRVFVSDINGIQVFDGDGRFLEHFDPVRYAHGLNFDLQSRLYIASNEPEILRMVLRD